MKLKFEVEFWSWILKLKFEVEVWSWSLKLMFQVGVWSWSWSLKLKFDVEVWSWSLKLKFEVEVWSWSLKLKFEVGKEENDKATVRSSYRSIKRVYHGLVTTATRKRRKYLLEKIDVGKIVTD